MRRLLIIIPLLVGCGDEDGIVYQTQSCVIQDNILRCPDGSQTLLPETNEPAPVIVDVEVLDPSFIVQNPDVFIDSVLIEIENNESDIVLCENSNRNGRKCKRIVKERR